MENQLQVKAHLVLSSGGVKCTSYAGAIAELETNGVEIANVSACSAGSLAGALLLNMNFCLILKKTLEKYLKEYTSKRSHWLCHLLN